MKTLITCLLLLGLFSCKEKPTRTSFNSEKWKTGNRKVRGTMMDSLRTSNILLNKNFEQVIQILGEPELINDDTTKVSYDYDDGSKVGPFGLGGPWIFWLHIDFDSTNTRKVISVFETD